MKENWKKLLDNIPEQDIIRMFTNLNRLQLNRKEHIKKYNRLRKLHGEILDSMEAYIASGKYNIEQYFKSVVEDIEKEIDGLYITLDPSNEDDSTILDELFIYKNHKKIPSTTEIYLEKNKFKNQEKIKMIHSMNNSYAGLFKVIDVDRTNGYITYEEVFTHKKVKIIDIALSSTLRMDPQRIIYIYNRIITFDDISFGTGIHCIMTSKNEKLNEFIKTHKHNKCSDFSRCLLLYNISKQANTLVVNYNNQYGNRR